MAEMVGVEITFPMCRANSANSRAARAFDNFESLSTEYEDCAHRSELPGRALPAEGTCSSSLSGSCLMLAVILVVELDRDLNGLRRPEEAVALAPAEGPPSRKLRSTFDSSRGSGLVKGGGASLAPSAVPSETASSSSALWAAIFLVVTGILLEFVKSDSRADEVDERECKPVSQQRHGRPSHLFEVLSLYSCSILSGKNTGVRCAESSFVEGTDL
jgi:hypothetical protein